MMSRAAKAAYYQAAGPLMKLNGWIYRWVRAPRTPNLKVHLGPGQRNYLPGWINVDANAFTGKCDVWADLRNRLPFRDNSAVAMYSHHVVEHLPDLWGHFVDVFRCLQPGGIYRVGGPNGDSAIDAFAKNDSAWFSDFPDSRKSLGGRFENFIFCRQEHLTILTESFLREVMEAAGFVDIGPHLPVKSSSAMELFAPCLSLESESCWERPHTLLLEGRKPLGGR